MIIFERSIVNLIKFLHFGFPGKYKLEFFGLTYTLFLHRIWPWIFLTFFIQKKFVQNKYRLKTMSVDAEGGYD